MPCSDRVLGFVKATANFEVDVLVGVPGVTEPKTPKSATPLPLAHVGQDMRREGVDFPTEVCHIVRLRTQHHMDGP